MTMKFPRELIWCFVFVIAVPWCAWSQPSSDFKAGVDSGWDDAWSWGNAFVVKNYVDQLYFPYAVMLLSAEKELRSGKDPKSVVRSLSQHAGVSGSALILPDGSGEQYPTGVVPIDTLRTVILKRTRNKPPEPVSPMQHRTVGGIAWYAHIPAINSGIDAMVRTIDGDSTGKPSGAVMIFLDERWLISQIPGAMDSLYRENSQLLFCAASPTNHKWEQSLGVVAGTDTLWWVGRKDVKIHNVQVLWPFLQIKVPSYVETTGRK
jgi:hypothetical protein